MKWVIPTPQAGVWVPQFREKTHWLTLFALRGAKSSFRKLDDFMWNADCSEDERRRKAIDMQVLCSNVRQNETKDFLWLIAEQSRSLKRKSSQHQFLNLNHWYKWSFWVLKLWFNNWDDKIQIHFFFKKVQSSTKNNLQHPSIVYSQHTGTTFGQLEYVSQTITSK